ncbi:MFS transporter [Achromobacter sp.]|uniref:MFS transporter n=1 Tax=Achromobacter sp. TaxID=134375 RepID=UPI003C790A10
MNSQPYQPYQRFTLAMLMAVVVISIVDKLIFAFAGPAIIRDLSLTPVEFGYAASAFFFVYSIAGVTVGFLANRVKTKWILIGMSLVWAVSQFMVSFAGSFAVLVASRLLLGAGTGPATAVTQHAGFKWYQVNERISVSTMVHISMLIGGLLASAVLPLSIERLGWRTSYLLLGLISVVWVALWLPFSREGSVGDQGGVDEGPKQPYRRLLLNRSFLMIALMGIICYLPSVLGVSWLAVFLQQGVGLSAAQTSIYLTAMAVTLIMISLLMSARSKRALRKGASFRKAMVWPGLFACMLGAAAYVGMRYASGNAALTLTLYFVGSVAMHVFPPFAFAIIASLSGTTQRGAMLAIQNGLASVGGVVAPALIGHMISAAGGDVSAGLVTFLTLCGAAALVTSILALMLLDPERTRKDLEQDSLGQAHLRPPAAI